MPPAAAILGALLSALAVVYASSLVGALACATVFFLFYRQLDPRPRPESRTPAPDGPANPEQQRRAA